MNRSFSVVALVAFALVAFQTVSAEAKGPKAQGSSHVVTNANTITKRGTPTKVNQLGSGDIDPGYFKKPIRQLPPGELGHGPVIPPSAPTPPITFGGNPPRAPSHDCGKHNGEYCHHGFDHCRGFMWFGDMCLGDGFNVYFGDSCDDGCGDSDFDSCP
jgi:hypothetical protein